MFIATFDRWGEKLSKFKVLRETEKTITVDPNSQERLMGSTGISNTTHRKLDPTVFITRSGVDAARVVVEHGDKRIAQLRSQIHRIESDLEPFRKVLRLNTPEREAESVQDTAE